MKRLENVQKESVDLLNKGIHSGIKLPINEELMFEDEKITLTDFYM